MPGGLGKTLLVLGLVIAAAGLLVMLLGDRLPLGRLPGDIVIDRPGFRLYFPIVTSIVVSVVIVKKKNALTPALDYIIMLPMALSGTVLGIGMMTAFGSGPITLSGTTAIMSLMASTSGSTKKLLTDNPTWRFRPIFASASSVTP